MNIMADKTVQKVYGEKGLDDLEKTSVTLTMYNKSEVKPLGKKRFKVVNPKNKSIKFLYIVTGACKSILGLRASEHLQLLTINKQNILAMDCNAVESGVFTKGDCLSHYKDVFSGGGKLEVNSTWRLTRRYKQFNCQRGGCQLP